MPLGPQLDDLAVQVDANATTHADDHAFAVHGLDALFEVLDNVACDDGEPLLGADHGFELRPLGLELLLAVDLFALGRLLELRIDLRPLGLIEPELRESALVIDGHGGAVLHGALDVVHADVFAEYRPGVGVRQLDRRAREANERGVRQGVAHVSRKAIDEVVLAAMGFVSNHDDVSAFRERRMSIAAFLGKELVNRGEHHTARGHGQQLAQIRTAFGPSRRLPQQLLATREGREELIVEVVAIGEYDDGRVLHRRLADDAAGIERHRETLARPLRVPHHAHAPIARLAAGFSARFEAALWVVLDWVADPVQLRSAQRLAYGDLDSVELVIARHLLDDPAAV